MVLRIILFAFVLYFGVRLISAVLKHIGRQPGQGGGDRPVDRLDVNEMAQDPVCGTYIAVREALTLRDNGKPPFFCSAECRGRYVNSKG